MPGFLKIRGRGRQTRRAPGEMNRLEAKYAEHLELRKQAGEIADYRFDAFKLRLADKCFYTPDFFVMLPDGVIEVVEVKGHWEDDARVKIKVAAETFWWFTFIAVTAVSKKHGGGWNREEF